MILRKARDSDLPSVARLHSDSWQRTYAGMLPDRFLTHDVPLRMAADWQPARLWRQHVLVAEAGRLAGFAAADIGDGALYVDNLHVAAGCMGQGIGRRLMGAMAQEAEARGCARLWLTVLEDNGAAIRFYQGLGGTVSEPFDDDVMGHPVRSVAVAWEGSALDRLGAGVSQGADPR